jgi:hypothetical protein
MRVIIEDDYYTILNLLQNICDNYIIHINYWDNLLNSGPIDCVYEKTITCC